MFIQYCTQTCFILESKILIYQYSYHEMCCNKSCGYQSECVLFPHVCIMIHTDYSCHCLQTPIFPLTLSYENLITALLPSGMPTECALITFSQVFCECHPSHIKHVQTMLHHPSQLFGVHFMTQTTCTYKYV
jgi:hypothetical protein